MAASLMLAASGTILAQFRGPPPPPLGPQQRALLARQAAVAQIEAVEQELEKNPGLLNDQQYLDAHPRLQQCVTTHPEATKLIQQNPQAFFAALKHQRGVPNP